jgi:tRNA-splicing ligase RtcB
MGTHSYIAVAQPGTAKTYRSVAHGAGRTMEKDEAKVTYESDEVERELAQQGIHLYRSGTDNIAGQAPASFKSPHQVLDVMKAFDLVRPVVRLRPVAVLKG